MSTSTTYISQSQNLDPIEAGPDADAINKAYQSFVREYQKLFNILIGKSDLYSNAPFIGAPIAAVLRQVESVIDASRSCAGGVGGSTC